MHHLLVGEQVATSTTEGAAETAAPALTHETMQAAIAEAIKGITSKYNGELAALRKQLRAPSPEPAAADAAKVQPQTPTPAAVSLDDLRASRELGKLESQLPAPVAALLEEDEEYAGMTPRQQAGIVRRMLAASKAGMATDAATEPVEPESAGAPETGTHRGEMPAKRPAKANTPARRETVPTPRTQKEWIALLEKDRRAAEKLLERDDFDPTRLPRQ